MKIDRVYVDAEGQIEDGHGNRFEDQKAIISLLCSYCGESPDNLTVGEYPIEPIQVELQHQFYHGGTWHDCAEREYLAWVRTRRIVARIVTEEEKPAPVVDKTDTIEQFLKDRIKHAFESIEYPGGPASQQYPFDEHTKEEMVGMKRAYSDVLTSLPELRQLHQQPTEWIPVSERPLYVSTKKGWEVTKDGEGEFWAAVPISDNTWWVKHCVVEDEVGLCVVCNDDNEPAGFALEDVTHFIPISLPEPPKP